MQCPLRRRYIVPKPGYEEKHNKWPIIPKGRASSHMYILWYHISIQYILSIVKYNVFLNQHVIFSCASEGRINFIPWKLASVIQWELSEKYLWNKIYSLLCEFMPELGKYWSLFSNFECKKKKTTPGLKKKNLPTRILQV